MLPYRISYKAQLELEDILLYRAGKAGWESSMVLEDQLNIAFEEIGRGLLVPHSRPELARPDLLFAYSRPYVIVVRRHTLPAEIVAIVHGARDLKRILRNRT
jgi:plasmid stabilization system protein ParE